MIDVMHQINSVRRTVGDRTLEAGEARTVTISQTYDADIEDVWDAITNAERLPRWFTQVDGDLRLGGRYQVKDNASGKIESCDPPRSFAATWEYGGDISWIEVRLTLDPDGGTRFELEHIAQVSEHWTEFGPGAVGMGWDMAVLGLRIHLESGGTKDPEEIDAWLASEEGRRFLVLSGEAWLAADIASGTDEEDARARGQRTIEAYTARPEGGGED